MQTTSWNKTVAIYAGSPRASGNTDLVAELIHDGITLSGGTSRVIHVRKFPITPCTGCRACDAPPHQCIFHKNDQAHQLFFPLMHSPAVDTCVPIYYYHVPAFFKAFMDRGQSYYARSMANDPEMTQLPARPAFSAMVAARVAGDKLFEGALLSMKYFLQPFNLRPEESLLLRGLDMSSDLAGQPALRDDIRRYGEAIWLQAQLGL